MSKTATTVAPGVHQPRTSVTETELRDLGVNLLQDFPGSAAADFKRYPVLSEGGWFLVIKHQGTLVSVSREPWKLLGPVPLTSDGLVLE